MDQQFGPYPGIVRDWHDGDTCHVDLDLGFMESLRAFDIFGHPKVSCRIFGINAPELSTDQGKQAQAYAVQICPPGTKVIVVSHGLDKYGGRFDGSIQLPAVVTSVDGQYTGDDYGTLMLHANLGVVVDTG